MQSATKYLKLHLLFYIQLDSGQILI